MNNTLRRILSLLLALTLAVTPLTAAAEGRPEDTDEPELIEQITEETPEESPEETQSPEESAPTEPEETEAPIPDETAPEQIEEPIEDSEELPHDASVLASIVDSGTCGTNVTWTLDSDGLLTISGSGKMKDYYDSSDVPWDSRRSSVKSVVIEDGVTSIGGYAFNDCTTLTNVVIGNNVTTIGSGAFEDCSSLTSVVIGNSVMIIGDYAFDYCNSLMSVVIPDSVTTIGDEAFDSCFRLTSVVIGNRVTTIGNGAFGHCYNLTDVVIPNNVKTISDYAFWCCDSLTNVVIPDSVTTIGHSAFAPCDNLTTITVSEKNPSYTSEDGVLFNKAKTELIQFPGGKSGGYTIPNSVTIIGGSAFYDCTNLMSVVIPDSVTTIGDEAFEDCTSLTSVVIGNSVTTIGYKAFGYCYSLTSVVIGNSVTTIGNYAFYDCGRLTSVAIGNSVTTIGIDAFSFCSSLTSVVIGSSVTTIGGYAFYSCSSLTSVVIGSSVTTIGGDAFSFCSSLTSVVIPDSVTTIGYKAFYSCDSLTDVYYTGTEAQWKAIQIGAYNTELTSATIHYNYTPDTPDIPDPDPESPEDLSETEQTFLKDLWIQEHRTYISGGGFAAQVTPDFQDPLADTYTEAKNDLGNKLYQTLDTFNKVYGLQLDSLTSEDEYELLISQILFSATGQESQQEEFMKQYQEAIIQNVMAYEKCAKKLVGNADELSSLINDLKNSKSMDALFSKKLNEVFDSLEPFKDDILTKAFMDSWNKRNTVTAPLDITVDFIKNRLGSIKKVCLYLAVAEAYTKSAKTMQTQILLMRQHIAVPSADERFNFYTMKNVLRQENVNAIVGGKKLDVNLPRMNLNTLANVLEKMYYVLDTVEKKDIDTLWTELDRNIDKEVEEKTYLSFAKTAGKTLIKCFPLLDKMLGVFSSVQDAIDFGTQVDERNYQGTMLMRLAVMNRLQYLVLQDLKNFTQTSDQDTLFQQVVVFDAGITAYRAITEQACQYAAGYWQTKTKEFTLFAGRRKEAELKMMLFRNESKKYQSAPPCHPENLIYHPENGSINWGDNEMQLYTIACPVTVTVQSPTGEVIAVLSGRNDSVKAGYKSYFLTVPCDDGTGEYIKILYIPEQYEVSLKGTASGMMNAIVSKVTSAGELNATVFYENVPVSSKMTGRFDSSETSQFGKSLIVNEVVVPETSYVPNLSVQLAEIQKNPVKIEQEYLAMHPGETVQLTVSSEFENVTWTTENAEDGASVISVDSTGKVKALNPGTAYAIASVTVGEETYSARCRIDVVEKAGSTQPIADEVSVNGVTLLNTKATVELYRTDYTRISVLLNLSQNMTAMSFDPTIEDTGHAIEDAWFEEDSLNAYFSLRIVDDRTLEIQPTAEALLNPDAVKSAKSAICLSVDGKDFTTVPLALTVKKTLPTVKAKAVKINSFDHKPVPLTFTGGKVLSVSGVLPKDFKLDGMNLIYTGSAAKASAKLNLFAAVENVTLPRPVTVSVSVTRTEPALKLGASSVTLMPGTQDVAQVTVTPAEELELELRDARNNVSNALSCIVRDGKISVFPTNSTETGVTYKLYVNLPGASKKSVLSIKTVSADKAKLTLKAAGSIDTAIPNSPVTLTAKIANYHAGSGESYKVTVFNSGENVTNLFQIRQENAVLTITAAGEVPKGTYTAVVGADLNNDGTIDIEKSQKLSVKWSDPNKVPVSVTLKASGSIDVIRPGTAVTLTAAFKNWFSYVPSENDLVFYKNKVEMTENIPFTVKIENGSYVISGNGADSSAKYTVAFRAMIGGKQIVSKAISLSVKMSSVKVSQSVKTISLLKKDRFDSKIVEITVPDGTKIDHITQNESSVSSFAVEDLGLGRYAISFRNNRVPPKGATIKLNVYLVGNQTGKPNANVSVKVNIT